jgi:hypothetical protein
MKSEEFNWSNGSWSNVLQDFEKKERRPNGPRSKVLFQEKKILRFNGPWSIDPSL